MTLLSPGCGYLCSPGPLDLGLKIAKVTVPPSTTKPIGPTHSSRERKSRRCLRDGGLPGVMARCQSFHAHLITVMRYSNLCPPLTARGTKKVSGTLGLRQVQGFCTRCRVPDTFFVH